MEPTYNIYQFQAGKQENCNYIYIIVDKHSKQAAIVDPAWDLNLILKKIETLGVKLSCILLTHSHDDHVNMMQPLVTHFDAKVYMSSVEIDYYGFCNKNLCPIQDLDIIKLGETQITCLLTPGHTAGGTCYLLSCDLLSGDTIFTEGCGICDAPGGSSEAMFESVNRIKRTVHPTVRVFSGHSYGKEPGHTLAYLLENNIYFQLTDREHFINFRMRKNQKHFFHLH